MANERFETLLKLKRCPDDVELKILEAAENGVENWSDEILQHLISCQSCRLMLEDYIKFGKDLESSFDEQDSDLPDNHFIIFTLDGIHVLNEKTAVEKPMLFRGRSAPQKKDDLPVSNIFSFKTKSGSVKAEMSWNGDNVKIVLSGIKSNDKFYLLMSDTRQKIYGIYSSGLIIFDQVKPGIYVIAEDKPDGSFNIIHIKK